MRQYLYLASIWIAMTLVLGFVGSALFQRIWRNDAEADLQRDGQAIERIIAGQEWGIPPESDSSWQALEQDMGVAMVPMANQAKVSAGVVWQKHAGGGWRVSVEQMLDKPLAVSADTSADAVRLTRVLGPSWSGYWWRMWGLFSALVMAAVLFSIQLSRRQIDASSTLLRKWVMGAETKAIRLRKRPRNEPADAELLPSIEYQETEFEIALGSVADFVNRTYRQVTNANERSELVFRNLQEGVLAVDHRSRVLLANQKFGELLELDVDGYLYRPLLEVVRHPAITNLVASVLNHHVSLDEELEIGSQPLYFRFVGSPIPLGGTNIGALITVRDETQLRRVELIRRDFVANASHELKTPLAAIRAYAETLELGAMEDPENASRFLSDIISQADRMDEVVNGMLQLSRAEAGKTFRSQRFEIGDVVDQCAVTAKVLAKAKHVEFAIDCKNPKAAMVSDRAAIQTILGNLLSNAIRYTEDRGWVRLLVQDDDQELHVEVSDSGIGIAPDDLERVFERFYRADKARSGEQAGTGLGLAMVKHLTNTLGGSVRVESEPGKGTTFFLSLPRYPAHASGQKVGEQASQF